MSLVTSLDADGVNLLEKLQCHYEILAESEVY
jgi:hypothetical protein